MASIRGPLTRSRRRDAGARPAALASGLPAARSHTRVGTPATGIAGRVGAVCERAAHIVRSAMPHRAPILLLRISSVSDSRNTSNWKARRGRTRAGPGADVERGAQTAARPHRTLAASSARPAWPCCAVECHYRSQYERRPAPIREKFLLLLQRSTSSLHMMLDDVMNLARLQAGQEHRAGRQTVRRGELVAGIVR